ncbi:MAG: hypothetical protein ABIH09_01705 [Candidatus Omnitrophota bacterium]
MNEQEFWNFIKKSWKQGRRIKTSVTRNFIDPELQVIGKYFEAHVYLPKNYEELSEELLIEITKLLYSKKIQLKTKEAILIILAHQKSRDILKPLETYCKNADKEIKAFAMLALDEYRTWNN